MGAYDAPSSSSSYSSYTGGSDIGGYSGSGNTTYNPSTGGTTTSPTMGGYVPNPSGGGGKSTVSRPVTPTPATAGPIYAAAAAASSGSAPKPTPTQNTVSPVGFAGNPLTMGQAQPAITQAPSPQPTFANVDPATGIPYAASGLSPLGQLASTPLPQSFAPQTGAASSPQIDQSISPIGLSSVDFTGMTPDTQMPGGLTNYASSPLNPGYFDPGITAMRMSAYDPADRSISYYMDRLNELDPRFQTTALKMMNERMDAGIPTAVTPHGAGRSYADQVQLYAEKLAGLNPNPVAFPGTSLHSMSLPEGALAIDLGGRSLTPEQTTMANQIATQAGAYFDPSDPGHFQAVPWQSGAYQVAEAKYPSMSETGTEPSSFQSAMNTVSNIASELFGVKPAQAETVNMSPTEVARMTNSFYPDWFQTEVPVPPDALKNMYERTEPFGGAEIMSPFVGVSPELSFPPRSQQQMLNALGIAGQPVPAAPTQQEMLNVLGIKGAPYEGLLPGQTKYQGRAPGAVDQAASLQPEVYPADIFPQSVFGRPEDMRTFGGMRAQPAEGIAGLTAFGLPGGQPSEGAVAQAAEQTPEMSLANLPTGKVGTFDMPTAIQQYRQALNDITVPSGTILGNVVAGPYANNSESAYYETDAQIAQKIANNLPLAGLTIGPDGRIMTKEGGMATPGQMQKVAELASGKYTVPQSNFPEGTTGTMTLDPRQFVNVSNVPLPPTRPAEEAPVSSFGAVAPQGTGLSGFETALGGLPAAQPRITTGITSPLSLPSVAGTPRQELPTPTRMTPEELRSIGIYQNTLEPGETIRHDFNQAYADATKRGLDTFQWTNMKTGKTDTYASGLTDKEADLPAKGSNEANLLEPSDETVTKLEDAGMIANGMSKEDYAAAMGVPVEDVKTRITTQYGPPMVEYYVKSLGESLAGITGGSSNLEGISNLFSMVSPLGMLGILGKNLYNQFSGAPSETAEEPTIDYNRSSGGGGGSRAVASTAPSGTSKSTSAPVAKPTTPLANVAAESDGSTYEMPTTGVFADRLFTGLPIDYANYGYGGEHQYYTKAARGGPISNLKIMGKR